jgi:anti-sigma28 factor (negative regulator of flagellin synthesis)
MSVKTQSIGALFVALVIILAVNPKAVNNLYDSLLGRLFLVCVVIFFAKNNTTLGLLAALAVITASNQFGSFVEGMEDQTPTTIGEDNTDTTGGQIVLTNLAAKAAKKKISDIKQSIADGTIGIDKEDIKTAIMSKDSKTIPVNPNMNSSSTGEVSPFTTGMLNTTSSSSLEGFSPYSSV